MSEDVYKSSFLDARFRDDLEWGPLRRQQEEAEAKRMSDDIDAQLLEHPRRKRGNAVRVLLLGQAESGKSTVLKNMRLMYTPTDKENASWRQVIQTNIVSIIPFTLCSRLHVLIHQL
jgi:hypothetical protein